MPAETPDPIRPSSPRPSASWPGGDSPINDEQVRRRQRVRRAVVQLKRGDMDALHFLYVSFAPDVQRTIQGVVHDHHESEDITHNVFAKLPRVIHRYEEREVPFSAWVCRVARNAALDHVRARRQIPVEEIRLTGHGFDQAKSDRAHDFQTALGRLPKEQRQVVAMRHIAGLTPAEIAGRMGKSEPAVHGLHHRGRAAMKEFLIELGAEPFVGPR